MDSLAPVTLVVKAPNQKIDDQVVECGMGWTIKKVKEHLSSVYPSRPMEHQQRLIYSGRLLSDHLKLKDVLRNQDSGSNQGHTVHLVCSPSHSSSSCSSTSQDSVASETVVPEASQPRQTDTDGLRNRFTPESAPAFQQTFQQPQMFGNQQFMQMPFMYQGVDHQQYLWYQQMYAQQMAQYYQMYQQQMGIATQQDTTAQPAADAVPAADAQPANRGNQDGQNFVMNAQGGAVFDDDDGNNNDWLDWFYIICRVGVLFSIVYFYSTFSRAVLAFLFFLLMYCYQMGWLNMDRRNQRQNVQPEQPAPAPAPVPEPQPPVQQEINPDDTEREPETNNETPEVIPETEVSPPPPHPIKVAFTFLTTFVTSLVPDTPPPVNAN